MPKVLGLMGSPRRECHTDELLEACLTGTRSAGATTEKLYIDSLAISPCSSCYACARLGHCVVDDDMQVVYSQLAESDIILLASPLYFFGISAQLKALIDRGQVFWSRQNKLGLPALLPEKQRVGAFLCTGGAPNRSGNNFAPAVSTAKVFFQALQVQFVAELAAADTDQNAVKDRPELLKEARALGERLVKGSDSL